jgi:hypothetical protein
MSEFAPTLIETETPHEQNEATIIEFPTAPDESKRFEDKDFAYDTAQLEDIQREAVNDARADVERALAQDSPLVDKYRAKLTNAEVGLKVNSAEAEKFYDRHYRQHQKPKTDDLRLAA